METPGGLKGRIIFIPLKTIILVQLQESSGSPLGIGRADALQMQSTLDMQN
jgi:hypothetical protein